MGSRLCLVMAKPEGGVMFTIEFAAYAVITIFLVMIISAIINDKGNPR